MTRSEILQTAEQYVTKDRADTHGDAEDNFQQIADLWSMYLDKVVYAQDVAVMMVLFKVARAKSNPKHIDNYVDMAGYAALAGEMASND